MNNSIREEIVAARQTAKGREFFERVVRDFHGGVFNYLAWMTRNTTLAEDLTQETFLALWRNPPEKRNSRSLKAWLFRVARNEYLQSRRRADLAVTALEDCPEHTQADRLTPGPPEQLIGRSFSDRLEAAVQRLPDKFREVIVLHNLEGLSIRQIAAALEIPEGTVKSRRSRALSLLRDLLSKEVAENAM